MLTYLPLNPQMLLPGLMHCKHLKYQLTGLGINSKKTKINLLGSNFWGNTTTDANGVKEKKEIEKERTTHINLKSGYC